VITIPAPNDTIEAELGGKARRLRFSYRAIAKTEKLLEKPIAKLDFTALGINDICAIATAALAEFDRSITQDTVFGWMDDGELEAISKAVADAVMASQLVKGGGTKKAKDPPE
jgi:hypothetical protein